LKEVLRFATEKHKGQKRDDGQDYIVHPIRVAKLVDKYKGQYSSNREILLAAALLHDTLEDTDTSYKELRDKFGEYVASLVLELTTAKYACKFIGKAQYLAEKMQIMTNYALTIKLADRLDNLCDLDNTSQDKKQRTIDDTYYILSYIEKHRTYTDSQTQLANLIKEQLKKLTTEKDEQK
jgi:GTP pyrophosphokinase